VKNPAPTNGEPNSETGVGRTDTTLRNMPASYRINVGIEQKRQ